MEVNFHICRYRRSTRGARQTVESMEQDNEQDRIFWETLRDLESRPEIRLLKHYSQHKVSTTFSHSHNVAVCAHYLAVRWKKKVSMKELATGAMLHDYYLYDIRESGLTDYQHGIRHPLTALENAEKIFELSEKEKNIIITHMWPLSFSRKPSCTEAWLVNIADKYCAYQEMHRGVVHIEDILGNQAYCQGYVDCIQLLSGLGLLKEFPDLKNLVEKIRT